MSEVLHAGEELPFHPSISRWFTANFRAPTPVQAASWPLIARGEHVLVTAPTGSGKTLTAFLWALNQYASGDWHAGGQTRVLYVSPLKALNNDIQRNLLSPLGALTEAGGFPELTVRTRSGDTSAGERQRLLRRPPDILITTPESLSLLLTTSNGMHALGGVRTVILDEIHAIVDNRRGVQLMTSLERLAELAGEFQRLALSATVQPLAAVADYVAGSDASGRRRAMHVVNRGSAGKQISFRVRFPEEVRQALENGQKIWDPLADNFRDLIEHNTSTLFFTNSRRLAEKITLKINEDLPGPLAYAHHGSLAREIRTAVEQRLKAGELKAIVATSSLEMGIDIGHLDEVVLVQSPSSVAATLQRIGRSGHGVGQVSRGTLYPTHAQDFLEAAVLAEAVAERDIEPLTPLTGALDVLAQIIISCTAQLEWRVDDLFALLRRATPYRDLTREHFDLVVEMLAGRYAGSRVRELKPRIVYDRIARTIKAQKSAVLAFYNSGGTIPDRGYYKLRHVDTGAVIGELDEEFVWEATTGQTFAFGTQHWQINRITHNDVLVRPAAAGSQAPPFWRSESINRSWHFSARIGSWLEDAELKLGAGRADELTGDLTASHGFEPAAAEELTDYLGRQRDATGSALPHRHHLLLECVRTGPGGYKGPDDISQLVIHTFWGGRLNRPWALALESAWAQRFGKRPEIHADNNAVVIQVRATPDPAEVMTLVQAAGLNALLRSTLERSGYFGARFRECAGRALLLTKARFNQRLPLWMSRLQAKKLMSAVAGYADFPVLLETWRTCLADEFDLGGLTEVLTEIEDGQISWSFVTTGTPSPFAANVTFDQVSRYMYADDTPDAGEPSSLSDQLIAQAIANEALRPRLRAETVAAFLGKRQRTDPDYAPALPEDWQEWVKERVLIPTAEHRGPDLGLVRISDGRRAWLAHPEVIQGLIDAGLIEPGWVEDDVAKLPDPRDAVSFCREILSFYGPLTRQQIELLLPVVPAELLEDDGDGQPRFVTGRLLADDEDHYYCDAENFEILLRFQRAAARPDVTAKPVACLPAAIARWQSFGAPASVDRAVDALLCLRGYAAPVSVWLNELLPARLRGFEPGLLESAAQTGELGWYGAGRETITLCYPEQASLILDPVPASGSADDPGTAAAEDNALAPLFADRRARYSFEQLAEAQSEPLAEFADRFWRAVWSGELTTDTTLGLRQGLERGFAIEPLIDPPGAGRPVRAHRRGRNARRGFAGSWQLRPQTETEADPLTELEDARERARLLLDRYGFVARELANREGGVFRWARLFRALRAMELAGEVLAGYFYEGLSGPQFITPAALQQFQRDEPAPGFWINAMDPAAPSGLGLGDPAAPQRRPQNYLSYLDGELALVVENLGRRLTFLRAADDPRLSELLGPLEHLVRRQRRVTVETINGDPARSSLYLEPLGRLLKVVKDHRHVYVEADEYFAT